MSQWTHVNASIRFDGIMGLSTLPTEKELGKMCKWGDKDDSHWDNPDLPCGSEGSLEYTIIKTGTENSIACMAIIFIGDLRDYDDDKEILAYFNKITTGQMIRSGVLEIQIEYNDTIVYRFNDDSNQWEECSRVKYKQS
jgi:hypothetical protein